MCSVPSQKYVHQVPVSHQQNMFVRGNGLSQNFENTSPSAKQSYIPIQTVVLAFSILFCIFSCLLTITLSYKWHTETNHQIDRLVTSVEEVIHDLNTFTLIVRNELVAKHVTNGFNEHKAKNKDDHDYEFLEEDYDGSEGNNQFMDKDLDSNWPKKTFEANDSHGQKNRKRRNAEVNSKDIVKNELTSSNIEKTNVNLAHEDSNEENTVKTYTMRKAKKMGVSKKKSVLEQDDGEPYEDTKENSGTFAAAHFTSDSSKYSTRTHKHYEGNGRLRHPNGDFRDWTQYLWDTNVNNAYANHFHLKNGKVEVLKWGLYFVYAQIYYSDQHDINGYYVMKNDEKVLGCTTTRHRDNQSDSCYTGGLIYLNSNDVLSIKGLDSERYILLDPVKSFFGLFKISNDNKTDR